MLGCGKAPDDTVVIYPEGPPGRPIGGKYVVRWILNTPGVIWGDGKYADDELIFLWSTAYHVDPQYTVRGLLTA